MASQLWRIRVDAFGESQRLSGLDNLREPAYDFRPKGLNRKHAAAKAARDVGGVAPPKLPRGPLAAHRDLRIYGRGEEQ